MKRLHGLLFACFFLTAVAVDAQQPPQAQPSPPPASKAERSYMAIGFHLPFMYFIEAEDGSMESGGITLKAPVSKAFGVQFSINKLVVPIKEYTLNTVSRTGAGEEEFLNLQLGFLYFMPFHRFLQAKIGLDYFKFENGYIADNPTGTTGDDCGVLYTHCKNCAKDLYGVFIGLNLDVPIYDRILIMTALSYHYILNDHPSMDKGFVNFNLGIGYRI